MLLGFERVPYFFTKERAEKHIQRQLIATCIMNLEASTVRVREININVLKVSWNNL